MGKTYDSYVEMEIHGGKKHSNFCGDVTSVRYGPPDADGIQRNHFRLRRMWVNGRRGVYVKLEPHDMANQEVGISLTTHQAGWLIVALTEAIAEADEYESRKALERTRARERRRAKKATAVKPSKE